MSQPGGALASPDMASAAVRSRALAWGAFWKWLVIGLCVALTVYIAIVPLGFRVPGRRQRVVTREPGDLPSVVVMREHVGRGVLTVAEPIAPMGRKGRLRSR